MKLSFITPTAFIKTHQSQGDFVLALSHLMKADKITQYEKNILKAGIPIILDNGLFENSIAEELPSLIHKAIRIKATHVFVPDVLFNAEGTKKNVDDAVNYLKKIKGYKPKIAAVAQASCARDYFDQLIDFENNPDIDLVGLSILAVPTSFRKQIHKFDVTKSRMYLLRKMKKLADQGYKWSKKYHLLGLGDSYEDVFFAAKHCPWVVSNDTSSAFWNGVCGKVLAGDKCEVSGGKTHIPVDFGFKELNPKQAKRVQRNINLVKTNLKKYDKSN